MKKIISLMLFSSMVLGLLTGCGEKDTINETPLDITEPVQQEIILPEINTGDIRNDTLSSEIDIGAADLGDDEVVITEIENDSNINPVNRHIYKGGTFYYQQLNDNEKKVYEAVKYALENAAGKKSDYLEFSGMSEMEIGRGYKSVIDENPQILIQNDGNGQITELLDKDGNATGFAFKMTYDSYWTEVNVELAQAEIETAVKKIMEKMDAIEGDYYKVLWLYNYLINNIEYNMEVPWHPTIYGALVKKECACEGISEAFEYILNLYGIKTIGVSGISGFLNKSGEGDLGTHKWNMLKLDNEWYAFDVTWDIDKDLGKFLPYTYFAVNEEDISFAHLPFMDDLVPEATGKKYNYYEYNDLIVHNYTIEEIIRVGKKCYKLTPGYFSFKFENENDFVRALQPSEYNQWIPKVIQANKLTKWQYGVAYNPDLQIIEFAIFDAVQYE